MTVNVYMCNADYQAFQRGFKNSLYQKQNEYARKLLLGKPVVTIYRNRSLDDFVEMGSGLKKELRRILSIADPLEKEKLYTKIALIEENLINLVEICKLKSDEIKPF